MILMIDNYDSFTWNLVQYLGELGSLPEVVRNDEITVDVLPSAAGVPWEALREHVQDVELDGVRLRVLSLEGLLKTKTGARPKDQMDAAAIKRALEELGRG